MSDEFIDPLRDPRFPDRPQTPDFWRLSESILASDAVMDFEKNVSEFIDPTSLMYMARQRAAMAEMYAPNSAAMASFIDGFIAGARFAAAGGHRDT